MSKWYIVNKKTMRTNYLLILVFLSSCQSKKTGQQLLARWELTKQVYSSGSVVDKEFLDRHTKDYTLEFAPDSFFIEYEDIDGDREIHIRSSGTWKSTTKHDKKIIATREKEYDGVKEKEYEIQTLSESELIIKLNAPNPITYYYAKK